ncbi:fatty acid desaturase family protein [Dongia rigui]|uniref:Fatty acid desaturase n=1 Tax=Dongia rigui TaxID=940149 RepID=A0ABU5DZY0_9PROT|nr:fatty acid desaturase [Dongia rigui]MDY0872892.1 fatty acid desaturase [Dongia rigui]
MIDRPITALETARFGRINRRLFGFYAASSLAAFFLLPLAVHLGGPVWAWALLPLALIANGYWATLHEAIHGQLFAGAEVNRRGGRVLAILWGSSFRLLRFGHLMHHRFNRHKLDRPDSYDPKRTGAGIARLRFFAEIFCGLYIIEVLTPLLYLLPRSVVGRIVRSLYSGDETPMPRLRSLAEQALAGPKGIAEIRQDALLSAALIALALLAWGPYWPAFAAFLLGRGFLVSFLDNVYHFHTPLDEVDYAYNLSLPRPLQALFLNMNMHRVHHRRMHLPWWQLPRQFTLEREHFDASLMRGALRQLTGPAPVATPPQR